jgi:hypothetical protein
VEARVGALFVEDSLRVAPNVSLVETRAVGDVLARAAREVVEHVHLVASGEQRFRDVRADEARSVCHHRPHGAVS